MYYSKCFDPNAGISSAIRPLVFHSTYLWSSQNRYTGIYIYSRHGLNTECNQLFEYQTRNLQYCKNAYLKKENFGLWLFGVNRCSIVLPLQLGYTRKNTQGVTDLQASCKASVYKLSIICVRTSCSKYGQVVSNLSRA